MSITAQGINREEISTSERLLLSYSSIESMQVFLSQQPTYILHQVVNPAACAMEVSHVAANTSFDKILDLTAKVFFVINKNSGEKTLRGALYFDFLLISNRRKTWRYPAHREQASTKETDG